MVVASPLSSLRRHDHARAIALSSRGATLRLLAGIVAGGGTTRSRPPVLRTVSGMNTLIEVGMVVGVLTQRPAAVVWIAAMSIR